MDEKAACKLTGRFFLCCEGICLEPMLYLCYHAQNIQIGEVGNDSVGECVCNGGGIA